MIPEAAVEALLDTISLHVGKLPSSEIGRLALEAALPYMAMPYAFADVDRPPTPPRQVNPEYTKWVRRP